MKKIAVYYRTKTGIQSEMPDNIEVQSNQLKDELFDDMEQFKKMLKTLKMDNLKTVIMLDRKRISDNDYDVYRMCKVAEECDVEIQFVGEKISSKDIIKEYEENTMSGMEMDI